MSLVDQIQKLFSRKSQAPQDSTDASMQDLSMDPLVTGSLDNSSNTVAMVQPEVGTPGGFAESRIASAEDGEPPEGGAELLSLPILGNRTIAQHQRCRGRAGRSKQPPVAATVRFVTF